MRLNYGSFFSSVAALLHAGAGSDSSGNEAL
jgi:hypothetical protein